MMQQPKKPFSSFKQKNSHSYTKFNNHRIQGNSCLNIVDIDSNTFNGNHYSTKQNDSGTQTHFESFVYHQNKLIRYFFYFLILFLHVTYVLSINQSKILTNSINKHIEQINVIQFSADYKSVYSLEWTGILKIWNFNLTNLELRQQMNVGSTINWEVSPNLIFPWNNGAKLFVGTNSPRTIKIYTLDTTTNLYILPPQTTPSLGDWLFSLFVTPSGNWIYVATWGGCKKLQLISGSWVLSIPTFFSLLGTGFHSFLTLLNSLSKIITFEQYVGLISVLKFNGTNYAPHQNFTIQIGSDANCFVSSNQLYICCSGSSNTIILYQFLCFKLDVSTDLYIKVVSPNTMNNSCTRYSYMNKNQIYTILQNNTKTIYKYKFVNSSGSHSYTLINSFPLQNNQSPLKVAYQRDKSEFQLISTYEGNIHLLYTSCNYTTSTLTNCYICYPDKAICNQCNQGYNLQSGRCDYCLPGYYVNGSICSRCGINCQNCSSLTVCSTCMPGWILNGTICNICFAFFYNNGTTCVSCKANCYNCTNGTNCLKCIDGHTNYATACCPYGTRLCAVNGSSLTCNFQNRFQLINSTCKCKYLNQILSSDNSSCICPSPYKGVGGVCDNFTARGILNCANAQRLLNGAIVCLSCSPTSNQIIQNGLCVCKLGYHDPNISGVCSEKCGDGMVIKDKCDDFNTIAGDGCSEICQVQQGFKCIIVNDQTICKSSSQLRYLEPIQIFKDQISPKATLKLKILNSKSQTPFSVNKLNFIPQKSYISLYIIKNESPLEEVKIDDLNLLSLDSDYTISIAFSFDFTLQNLKARIQLNYQKTKYYDYTQKIDFTMKGSNMRLQYTQNISTLKNFANLNLLIIVLSMTILLVGLLTPKFIGLQMILTFQLIYFSQILIKDPSKWPAGFMYLKNLKYSTGYNGLVQFSQILIQSNFIKLYNINMKKHFVQNINITFLLVLLSTIVSVIILLKRFNQQNKLVILNQHYKIQKIQANLKAQQQMQRKLKLQYKKISFIYFLNQKSYNTLSQLSFWSILPFFAAISGFLLVKNQQIQYLENFLNLSLWLSLGKITVILLFGLILLTCLNNFFNFWIPKKNWLEIQKKKQQIVYKKALFLYLLVLGYLIFFYNDALVLNVSISAIVLLIQIIFMFILYKINPYDQSLRMHSVGLVINQIVYSIFLLVINMINYMQDIQLIIMLMGYFITGSCFIVIILSIIRLYYQYRYGQQLQVQIQKQRQQVLALQIQTQKIQSQNRAKKKLNKKQKQRFENKYLEENQKLQQEQLKLLEWLQKRDLTQQQKQKIYYRQYHQKPLSWLKVHDFSIYQKKVQLINQNKTKEKQSSKSKQKQRQKQNQQQQQQNKQQQNHFNLIKQQQLQQQIQKTIKQQPHKNYFNLMALLKQQFHKKMKSMNKKYRNKKKDILYNPGNKANMEGNDQYKMVQQEYDIKE